MCKEFIQDMATETGYKYDPLRRRLGYGFNGTGFEYERNQYFYHSAHLGSTDYVTDMLGEVNQQVEYSAFGKTFFEEHATSASTPYLFNGKERDEETGLYYYGARYYDAKLSLWMEVDPKGEKYLGMSPYNYTLNNPVRLVDLLGKEPDEPLVGATVEKEIYKQKTTLSQAATL